MICSVKYCCTVFLLYCTTALAQRSRLLSCLGHVLFSFSFRFFFFLSSFFPVLFCRLVGWSVCLSPLAFLAFSDVFCNTAPAQTFKLAFFITASAHPHATSVAVYPALFHLDAVSLQSQQVNQGIFFKFLKLHQTLEACNLVVFRPILVKFIR